MKKYAVFTMDVEDFSDIYCLRGKSKEAFPSMMDGVGVYLDLLEKYHIKGDLFVLANRLDKDREILKNAVERGHRIAVHGFSHELPSNETKEEFADHIAKAKMLIEESLSVHVQGFRAPGFSLRQDEVDILPQLGFRYDASEQDYKIGTYGANLDTSSFVEIRESILNREGFYEIKMPKSIIHPLKGLPIGGGAYCRIPPYSFVKKAVKTTIGKKSLYAFYCHPFEVSKVRIPRVGFLSPLNCIYLHRRKNYLKKIEDIIKILIEEGYEFVTYEELIDSISA